MTTFTPSIDTNVDKQDSEQRWIALYLLLLPLAKRWVYAAHIYLWVGQENDIAWDIVLVTVQRTYEYQLKAESENTPISSIQRFSIIIARNYFQDLRRKYSRVLPLHREGCSQVEFTLHDEIDVEEVVLDNVYEEWLFQEIAKEVARFSPKLRTAMLIDIARRMDFSENPTPLQTAFAQVGIELREYENLLPRDPVLLSRHSSLVSLGYRKLEMWFSTRESKEVVTSGA